MPEDAVWNILNRNLFFVKDAVKRSEAKFSDKLDVYDPETRQVLFECREPNLGFFVKAARLFGGRHDRGTPFDLVGRIPSGGQQIFRIKRGSATFTLGGAPMELFDRADCPKGILKRKQLDLGLCFEFKPVQGERGFFLRTEFSFFGGSGFLLIDDQPGGTLSTDGNTEYGDYFRVGKFDYAFSISSDLPPNDPRREVLLAVALAKHRVKV